MSIKNTDKQNTTTTSTSFSSMSGLLNIITAAFKTPTKPVSPLPPQLIITGANLRSGLSPSAIASRIISRQSQAGMVVGDVFGDGPNNTEAMYVVIIEEIINSILTEARVDVAIQPGITVTTIGVGNLGAPVLSNGATTNIGIGSGIIR